MESGRLPRTRGDGPTPQGTLFWTGTAAPHARGWTPDRRLLHQAARGCPARAGMDPILTRAFPAYLRLPRTRGDGPHSDVGLALLGWAAPHARGWTCRSPTARSSSGLPRTRGDGPFYVAGTAGGSTAAPHARGMDPASTANSPSGAWLPRTRGDGPQAMESGVPEPSAAPHARGWTRPALARDDRSVGCPARAGMDPQPALRR